MKAISQRYSAGFEGDFLRDTVAIAANMQPAGGRGEGHAAMDWACCDVGRAAPIPRLVVGLVRHGHALLPAPRADGGRSPRPPLGTRRIKPRTAAPGPPPPLRPPLPA